MSNYATKDDVQEIINVAMEGVHKEIEAGNASLRKEIESSNTGLRKEIESSNTSLRKEIENSNTSLRKEIEVSNKSLRQEIAASNAGLRQEIAASNEDLRGEIREAVTDLSEVIANFAQQVDARFNKIEADIADLRQSHDRLLNTIDGFVARIDKYETEQAVRDNQFEKLLVWAKKVSEKTGIPLENI